MEREIPRNVRQIGNISGGPKIYVEDYVDTFFGQISDQTEEIRGAFLIGEMEGGEHPDYIYITGAIQMYELKRDGNTFQITEETWKNAYEDCKRYFGNATIVGWFVSAPGLPAEINDEMIRTHETVFPDTYSVFVMRDLREKEDYFYVNKFNDLMKVSGYYIYYEKNPAMQNYMIASRRKNGLTISESVEDRAARSFRNLIRTKGESEDQKQSIHFMRIASSFLILVMLVMGITMMNNYDKIQSVQKSLEALTESAQSEQEAKRVSADNTPSVGLKKEIEERSAEKKEEAAKGSETESKTESKTESEKKSSKKKEADKTSAEKKGKENEETEVKETNREESDWEGDDSEELEEGSQGDIYVVRKGDTLLSISRKVYGTDENIASICKMNGLKENDFIYVGQKLILP
ncbi:MAG: LysM peptidoglycan-binding domain-containing protein [Lachnospiraceae bacterium]|nr:LysM peptidoglycan-binding domain-containing protein [Lachnospiraceae bacterium]